MKAVENPIPLRCQSCDRFAETTAELSHLEAEADFIDSDRETLERMFSPESVQLRLAAIMFRLVALDQQNEQDVFYTVGCPGVNLSSSVNTGEPIKEARCQSPFRETLE